MQMTILGAYYQYYATDGTRMFKYRTKHSSSNKNRNYMLYYMFIKLIKCIYEPKR